MEIDCKTRTGSIAIAAAVLWIVNWGLNLLPGVHESPPGSEWFLVTNSIAVLALLATAAVPAGLALAGAGGRGWFATGTLAAWSLGWLLVCAGGALLLVTGEFNFLVFFVGGNLYTVAGLVAAILVARAGVLTGWRRFVPLAWAVQQAVEGILQQIESAATLALVGELVGYLLIGLVGVAVLTTPAARRTADMGGART